MRNLRLGFKQYRPRHKGMFDSLPGSGDGGTFGGFGSVVLGPDTSGEVMEDWGGIKQR